MCLQLRVPEYPTIGEIEELWRSGHLGEENWDAEIAAIEKELQACSANDRPMELSDDEGLEADVSDNADIELDNEICEIMELSPVQEEPMDLSVKEVGSPEQVKLLDLSDDEKEAMAKSDDLANLNKINEAVAYCNVVLKALHPEVAPDDLQVSVWEAEFKDEEEVQIVTEL